MKTVAILTLSLTIFISSAFAHNTHSSERTQYVCSNRSGTSQLVISETNRPLTSFSEFRLFGFDSRNLGTSKRYGDIVFKLDIDETDMKDTPVQIVTETPGSDPKDMIVRNAAGQNCRIGYSRGDIFIKAIMTIENEMQLFEFRCEETVHLADKAIVCNQ